MNDFDKKIDNAVDKYEKGVNKVAPKIFDVAEKAASGLNRIYIGCITIFANLFLMGFCCWGVYAGVVAYRLETEGVVTEGTVIRLDESRGDGSIAYDPVIEFTVDGQTYTFESGHASNPPEYSVGEKVEVLYDRNDPNTAQINQFSKRWFMPVCIIPSMLTTLVVLNFVLIRAFRRNEDLDL